MMGTGDRGDRRESSDQQAGRIDRADRYRTVALADALAVVLLGMTALLPVMMALSGNGHRLGGTRMRQVQRHPGQAGARQQQERRNRGSEKAQHTGDELTYGPTGKKGFSLLSIRRTWTGGRVV